MDITYAATDKGWLYLFGIKDLFNGELRRTGGLRHV